MERIMGHRIKVVATSLLRGTRRRLALNLLGTNGQRLWGYVTRKARRGAGADTGTDVMLMSREVCHATRFQDRP